MYSCGDANISFFKHILLYLQKTGFYKWLQNTSLTEFKYNIYAEMCLQQPSRRIANTTGTAQSGNELLVTDHFGTKSTKLVAQKTGQSACLRLQAVSYRSGRTTQSPLPNRRVFSLSEQTHTTTAKRSTLGAAEIQSKTVKST